MSDTQQNGSGYKKSTIIFEGAERPETDESQYYISKEEFYDALVERKMQVDKAEKAGLEPPQISDKIGKCIILVANNVAKKSQFRNYPFREEMIADAILHCVRYVDSFDINHASKNPFSYYTQTCYYLFLNRIKKEKEQLYIRYKSSIEFATVGTNADDVEGDLLNYSSETPEHMNEFIRKFEEKNGIASSAVDTENMTEEEKKAAITQEKKKNTLKKNNQSNLHNILF